MQELKVGIKCEKFINVKKEYLANEIGSGDVPVFSTPMVVNAMESTASELLKKYLDSDLTSVGTKVSIEHIAPTLENVEVKVIAELINIEGRVCKFYVEACDNAGIIAKGKHKRIILNKEKFINKAQRRSEIVI